MIKSPATIAGDLLPMEWKMFSVEVYIILVEQEIDAISKIERMMINMIVA